MHSQSQQLAELLLEGATKDFILQSRKPQFVKDLVAQNWRVSEVSTPGRRYILRLDGFFLWHQPANGFVQLIGEANKPSNRLGVAIYDHALWCKPIGASFIYWQDLQPVLLIWQKTLMFNLPPDEDRVGPPRREAWMRNWETLRKDINLRKKR